MKVDVYCKQGCAPCVALKEWLFQNGVKFTVKSKEDAMNDPWVRVYSYPTVIVNDKYVVRGFNRPELLKVLRAAAEE